MGFFDKIFNSSSGGDKVRDQFKDKKYFASQIDRCNRFIESDEKNFSEFIANHGELKHSHYLSACKIRLQKCEIIYSLGEPIENIKPVFQSALGYFLKSWNDEFKNNSLTVEIISFCILLDISINNIKDFVEKWENSILVEEKFKPSSLIYYLIRQSEKKRKYYEPFDKLYDITKAPKSEAENLINDYLEKWYGLHKEDPWYNTHLRDKGYSGYWAWEVAAVVKVMGLDDTIFKDNIYYPYDIVHCKENN